MKQLIGYYKEVGISREYGALTAYLKGNVIDISLAKYVIYLIGNVIYVARLKEGNETLVAIASNFSFKSETYNS